MKTHKIIIADTFFLLLSKKQKNQGISPKTLQDCFNYEKGKFDKNKLLMLQLTGTYYEGKVHLEKIIPTDRPLKVTVIFEEEVSKSESRRLKFSDFSFAKTREILKDKDWSFSDTVIEEKREAL